MDSAALTSLTPLLDGIDKWVELAPLLPVIISLELILSADNAIALASITRSLEKSELQSTALNIGILISLCLRIFLILFSQVLLKYIFLQFLCGVYLLFLSTRKLLNINYTNSNQSKALNINNNHKSLLNVILLLSITDLAFSIDSITAAVSISDQLLLVISGAIIGVFALRFTSALFIKWLDEFTHLETAGYIAIGLIGFKLLIKITFPIIDIPEYIIFFLMAFLFSWGFSLRQVDPINS
tara:strand:- start:22853 stop:23575 length:723 start_codon:yes stop_codon:yes gene_type:complete